MGCLKRDRQAETGRQWESMKTSERGHKLRGNVSHKMRERVRARGRIRGQRMIQYRDKHGQPNI